MKVQATSYSFNAAAKTITFSGVIPANLESILHVANATTGALLFQPQAGALFAGTYSSPVLTLACSTTGMANGDRLLIFVEDGSASQTIDGRSSTPTTLATLSKARPERPRSRRMNRVIEDAGTEAWPAIRRSGRPSVRMAARRESEGAVRVCTVMRSFSPL
jgi:hypothetical protein